MQESSFITLYIQGRGDCSQGTFGLNSRDELLHLLTRTTPVSVYNLLKDYGINSLDYWMRNKADQKGFNDIGKKVRKLD